MDVPFCPDAMNTLHGVPCLAGPCDGVGRKRPRREIAAESPGGRPPKRPVRDIALTDDSDRFDRCQQVQSDDDKKKDSDGEDDGCLYDLAWTLIVEHALASTRVDLIAARVRDALSLALTCRTLYATVQRLRVRFDRLRARMGPLDGADWVSLVPWTETIDVVYGLSMYCKWEGPRALGPAPRVTLPTLPSVALLAPREDDTTGVWYELATGVLCAAPLRPGTRDAPGEGAPSTGSEDSGDDEEDYVRGESHLVCRLKMPVVEYIEDWTWWESAEESHRGGLEYSARAECQSAADDVNADRPTTTDDDEEETGDEGDDDHDDTDDDSHTPYGRNGTFVTHGASLSRWTIRVFMDYEGHIHATQFDICP